MSHLSVLPIPPVINAAYVSDELKAAALVDEDIDPEESPADGEPSAKYMCPEKELSKTCPSYQNSPAAEFSSHEMSWEEQGGLGLGVIQAATRHLA